MDREGIETDPAKIESIQKFPIPRESTDVRSFMGLAGYYRKFIANFSQIAETLSRLTWKELASK